MFDTIIKNQVAKWIMRRLLELGGFGSFVMGIYFSLPQATQDTILRLIQQDFDNVSVRSAFGVAAVIGGLIWNWRSTFRPHIITADKQKVDLANLPTYTQDQVKDAVQKETGHRPKIVSKP